MFKYYKWRHCSLHCIVSPSVSTKTIWGFFMCCAIFHFRGFPAKDYYLPLNLTKLHNLNEPGKGSSERSCITNFLKSKEQFSIYNHVLTIWGRKAEIYSFQKSKSSFGMPNPDYFISNYVSALSEESKKQETDTWKVSHSKSSKMKSNAQDLILIIYVTINSNRSLWEVPYSATVFIHGHEL